MAELPEINKLAIQMQEVLVAKHIEKINIFQEKGANVDLVFFRTDAQDIAFKVSLIRENG
jgi:hypothetical protein